jgi:hypothetical protein
VFACLHEIQRKPRRRVSERRKIVPSLRTTRLLLLLRPAIAELGNKRKRLMANRSFTLRQAGSLALHLSVAIILFLPARLQAQAKGTISLNPINPLGLRPITNYPKPFRNAVTPSAGRAAVSPLGGALNEPKGSCFTHSTITTIVGSMVVHSFGVVSVFEPTRQNRRPLFGH